MKKSWSHTARNRAPILEVLTRVLPAAGDVLEIAAGTGENARDFAAALPGLRWQATDVDLEAVASIAAWRDEAGLPNLLPPLALDVTEPWPVERADAIVCINMVHITPWDHAVALLRGARRLLPSGGVLYLYGPYQVGGVHTAPSNAAFDASLRERNAAWGVRDLDVLRREAQRCALVWTETVPMPANNLSVIFTRR